MRVYLAFLHFDESFHDFVSVAGHVIRIKAKDAMLGENYTAVERLRSRVCISVRVLYWWILQRASISWDNGSTETSWSPVFHPVTWNTIESNRKGRGVSHPPHIPVYVLSFIRIS